MLGTGSLLKGLECRVYMSENHISLSMNEPEPLDNNIYLHLLSSAVYKHTNRWAGEAEIYLSY